MAAAATLSGMLAFKLDEQAMAELRRQRESIERRMTDEMVRARCSPEQLALVTAGTDGGITALMQVVRGHMPRDMMSRIYGVAFSDSLLDTVREFVQFFDREMSNFLYRALAEDDDDDDLPPLIDPPKL